MIKIKLFLIIYFVFLSYLSKAQDSNIFFDRTFWKTAPNIEVVEQKIAEGNDPVVMNKFSFDAVVYAILENAPIETIKYLLAKEGNPVDKITHDGRNYLLWAAYKGNVTLMKYLIAKGSQVDLIDDHGYDLLTFPAIAGIQDLAVYNLIIKNGIDIKNTNREGANALLLLAPSLKDEKVLSYFQEKGLDIHSKDAQGNGMFNYAVRKGNIKLMNKLIELGVDYKTLNKNGGNAVIFASKGSRGYTNPLEVYKYLEKIGIDIKVKNKDGQTALHNIAYRTKDFKIFEYFFNHGLDINQVDQKGNTPFLNSINGRNFEIAQKLLPKVNNINQENTAGFTALTYAIRRSSPELFDQILALNAKVDIIDKNGNNLIFHTFDAYNPKNSKSFEKFIEILQSKGVDPIVKQSKGNTLLHLAIEKGNQYLVEKSLELGVDINQKNGDGLTALHLSAMKAQDDKLLKLLLAKGADKSILTDFEESAFDLASENELLNQNSADFEFLKDK